MSAFTIVTSTRFQPASAQDLRVQLNQRREKNDLRGFDEPTTSDGQRRSRHGHRTPFQSQPIHHDPASRSDSPSDEPLFGGNRRVHSRRDVNTRHRAHRVWFHIKGHDIVRQASHPLSQFAHQHHMHRRHLVHHISHHKWVVAEDRNGTCRCRHFIRNCDIRFGLVTSI